MSDVLEVRDAYRAETWATLIQECNNSGLTKREFCQQRGISEKSYYYWLRKLCNQATKAAESQLIKLDPAQSEEDILHIRYHGAELRLPSGVDMDVVAAVLRSIQML